MQDTREELLIGQRSGVVTRMNDLEFLPIFLDEAQETLEAWESCCLNLENGYDIEVVNALFRSAHNIKGSSRSVGLEAYGSLVHTAEDVITKLKSEPELLTPSLIGVLLECQKFLVDWTEVMRSDANHVPDFSKIMQKLKNRLESTNSALTEVDWSAGFGLFDTDQSTNQKKHKDIGTILVEQGVVKQLDVEKAVEIQNRKIGEILVDSGAATKEQVENAISIQTNSSGKSDQTIRISLRKMDTIIRLAGELTIQAAILSTAKKTESLNSKLSLTAVDLVHKTIQDLQTEAMTLRMQPLDGLFQRMERIVKDVARDLNKAVCVKQIGADVELDKTVVEKIKDPLVHILRNAVDHGIEKTEERSKTKKPPVATICLEASLAAGNVQIKIRDDGKGLNEDRILKKAIEKGLVPSTSNPTPKEIHQMIFLPGFSTAEAVTSVSGRGVGMDVVRQTVDDLGGSIEIESTPGSGSVFSISLPTNLSVLDSLVIGLGERSFSVPLQEVQEVIDLNSAEVITVTGEGRVMKYRNGVIPLERLDKYLPSTVLHENEYPIAIVASDAGRLVAFRVDRIESQQAVIVRKLDEKLGKISGFSGATVLANGDPAMILDLKKITRTYLDSVA